MIEKRDNLVLDFMGSSWNNVSTLECDPERIFIDHVMWIRDVIHEIKVG